MMLDLSNIVPADRLLAPGLYFDLDEDTYHRSFGLSASGIKHLRISPLDWWVRSPLNPNLAEVLEEDGDSEAKTVGRAYDVRIISGREAFDRRYAPAIEKSDYPDALDTNDDLKEWLVERGLKKTGKRKAELIDRVLEAEPTARIWDAIKDGYAKIHEGKEFLPVKLIAKIETAARMIEGHPLLSKAFSGGAPQVSVIWDCPIIGVRCKARMDYLKSRAIVDLKTWGNPQGKPPEVGIPREIASRKYHVQAAMYCEAISFASSFIKQGLCDGVSPEYDPFVKALAADHTKQFMFVFQAKGVAPFARGYILPQDSNTFQIGKVEIDTAKQVFRTQLEKFGALPWIDDTPIQTLDDAAIPPWAFE